jgi:hypothetical protein
MAHDVFISYSSKDKPVADAACALLESRGIRCWIAPRDILPGAAWAASIPPAIGAAKVFLLIFSSSANDSDQVQREVDLAANRRLAIVPLRVENVLPQASLEYYIRAQHWLDAFTPPLEQHLTRLADAIALILSGETTVTHGDAAIVREPVPSAPGRTGLAALVGAVAVVVLAAGAWWMLRDHPPAPPAVAAIAPVLPPSALAYDRETAAADAAAPAAHKHVVVYARRNCMTQTLANGAAAIFCVSSTLGAQNDAAGRENAYGPQNLFDNNRATAWCEGVPGPGNGEEIAVTFSRPQVIDAITFVNGYAKSAATFAKNNSVHTLIATWPDGTASSFDLADRQAPYSVSPHHPGAVTGVTFRIESVNGGSKWPDTCVSELTFTTH